MLWLASDRKLRQIERTADHATGCRPARAPQPEECLERGHRGPPTVVPKDELVEIGLQMLTADAMVRPDEPLLQIADGAVCEWHDRGHATAQCGPVWLGAGNMSHACGLQAFPPFQAVGVDGRPGRDVRANELEHRRLFEIGRDRQAHPTGAIGAFLRGDQDDNRFPPFQLTTSLQPWLRATDPGGAEAYTYPPTPVSFTGSEKAQRNPQCKGQKARGELEYRWNLVRSRVDPVFCHAVTFRRAGSG